VLFETLHLTGWVLYPIMTCFIGYKQCRNKTLDTF